MNTRKLLSTAALAVAALAAPLASMAQDWPSAPIRLMVPFAAGGGSDIIARLIAPKLYTALGQQVVVENKPGGSSIIGTQIVAKAPADGYTLLLVDSSIMLNPSLFKNLPYDALKDFIPVIHVASGPVILAANPALPANTVGELIAEAKARPGALFYGSGGIGAPTHLSGELFNQTAGTQITHVPYKGTGEAISAAIGNQVSLIFTGISTAGPAIQAGKLKGLAVTGDQRAAALPDVPTFAQAGLPKVDNRTHWVLLVPAGTPPAVVQRLNAEFNKIAADPEVKERVLSLGYTMEGGTPETIAALTKSEIEKWGRVIKAAGIKAQ
ncbi:tripartite tricarboxylate transporter substrate binding protein [Bordetella sp. BOR01]|uniref:tripartite tricarboxylate transporter substrate binding protein n=1 Tax=Bordetella sp. BOR01 TaxID=2854779 RepID=UPI001C4952BC|nr:tripartite tricarboxylate transporter substrate binding protein [Bordetella sp. BOR01]MBV7484830.1 tripartite tricarboxylate transporter substrate binding protein [Bordetella sp. BOR01]